MALALQADRGHLHGKGLAHVGVVVKVDGQTAGRNVDGHSVLGLGGRRVVALVGQAHGDLKTLVAAFNERALLGDFAHFPVGADALFLDRLGIAGEHKRLLAHFVLQQELLVFVHEQRLAGKHGRAHEEVGLVQVLFVRGEHIKVGFLAHGHVECHLKLGPRRYLLLCHVVSPSRGRRYHRRARCTFGYCTCFAAGCSTGRAKWRDGEGKGARNARPQPPAAASTSALHTLTVDTCGCGSSLALWAQARPGQ